MKSIAKISLVLVAMVIMLSASAQKRKATKKRTKATVKEATTVAKKDSVVSSETFKIKVVRTSCASLVAIILDESFQKYGEEWVPYNVRMRQPYKAAVNIVNKCALPNSIKEGSIVKVSLITDKEAEKNPCVVCMMMDYPPASRINIKFIEDLGEEK